MDIGSFFEDSEVRDVVDAITLLGQHLPPHNIDRYNGQLEWWKFCERVCREEGMKYEVLNDGTVRYRIDPAFQAAGAAAVVALATERYRAAGEFIERSLREINGLDGDLRIAVRDAFDAVETCFKVAAETGTNFGAREVKATLAPAVQRKYANADDTTKSAVARYVESMADWANAAHPYRHGHDVAAVPSPTRELAVALVSGAIAHARFIAATFPGN
jgi:hypothetical protein